MSQRGYLQVVDRFSEAIQAFFARRPRAKTQELHDATGDLLEAVANQASEQSASTILIYQQRLEALEQKVAALERVIEREREIGS